MRRKKSYASLNARARSHTDLNARVVHAGDGSPCDAAVRVYFDDIKNVIVKAIMASKGRVIACVAWLTDPDIKKALKTKDASVIVTNDTRCYKSAMTRRVGLQRGASRPLMHNKFLVLFDSNNKPRTVYTGSFNYTKHSTINLENVVQITSHEIAKQYVAEFNAIWKIARA